MKLGSWAHVAHVAWPAFFRHLSALPDAQCLPLEGAVDADAVACLFRQDAAYQVVVPTTELRTRLAVLQAVADGYGPAERQQVPVHPSAATVQQLLHATPGTNLLVTFPALTPRQVLQLAQARLVAPAGMTRVVLPRGRVLGINIPLSLLRASAPATAADCGDR